MRRREDLIFPMSEYDRRLSELRQRMVEHKVKVMITTTPENICYLTGFESPGHYYFQALIIPLEGEPIMVPRRLEDSGVQELTWIEISRAYDDYQDPIERLGQVLEEFNLHESTIGFEKSCWFFTATQQEKLFAICKKAKFQDASGLIEQGRLIKSPFEIALMRKAARAAGAGMSAGIDAVRAGVTENDVAAAIHYAMIKAGGEWPSIAPFVASGYRGAIGHATWLGREIEDGDIVLLEVGGCVRRYHAAMMRTGFVGKPNAEARKAEMVVQEAMNALLEMIRPGVEAQKVDAAARKIISQSSLGAHQASRSGYSIGIGLPPDWGEGHILSIQPGETRVLETNMTFHILPWVQLPGKGGVSFSETVRVTENGYEILTNSRELFVK